MRYLRQNTATIVTVGPFFDAADGVTIETALTITNERISMVVDANDGSAPTLVLDNVTGAASATDNDLNYIANNDAGLMQLELTQANTNYVGRAFLTITDAANHCPVFHDFTILPGAVYDSLILGTDKLAVDAQEISSDATAADNLETALDGGTYNVGGGAIVAASVTTKTGYELTAAYDAAKTAATQTSVDDLPTNSELATALGTADDAVLTAIGDLPTVSEFEARTLVAASYATATDLATVDTVVDAIKAKTDLIPTDPADQSLVETAITAAQVAIIAEIDANEVKIETAISNIGALNTLVLDLPTNSELSTALGTADDAVLSAIDDLPTTTEFNARTLPSASYALETAVESAISAAVSGLALETTAQSILMDTETTLNALIQTVDTVVDAIKLKTDNLPTDPADQSAVETAISTAQVAIETAISASQVAIETAISASQVAVETAIDSAEAAIIAKVETAIGYIDTEVASILEDTGTTLPATLATLSSEGPGSSANVITINDGTNPVENAQVWVTTDSAGSNIIAGTLMTNSLGTVTFMLDVGVTYYLWVQKDGYNFTNPSTYVGV